jgi:hypothetical protein
VAAGLLGQAADNLNQAADRRVRIAAIGAQEKQAKADIEGRREIAAAEIEAEIEREKLRQEGFDKQREFLGEEGALDREATSADADALRTAQEQQHTERLAQEEKMVRLRNELDTKRVAAVARAKAQAARGEVEALVAVKKELRQFDKEEVSLAQEASALQTAVGVINGQLLPAAIVRIGKEGEQVTLAMEQSGNQVLQSVNAAVRNASLAVIGGDDFRKALTEQAQPSFASEFQGRRAIALVAEDVVRGLAQRGVFAHVSKDQRDHAQSRVTQLVEVLASQAYLTGMTDTAFAEGFAKPSLGTRIDVRLGLASVAEATTRQEALESLNGRSKSIAADLKETIDAHTLAYIVDGMADAFDFRAEGDQAFIAQNIIDNEGKVKVKGLGEKQTKIFTRVVESLSTIDVFAREAGIVGVARQQGDISNTLAMGLAAVAESDPQVIRDHLTTLAQEGTPDEYDRYVALLERGAKLLEKRKSKTGRLEDIAGRRAELALDIDEAVNVRGALGVAEAEAEAQEQLARELEAGL